MTDEDGRVRRNALAGLLVHGGASQLVQTQSPHIRTFSKDGRKNFRLQDCTDASDSRPSINPFWGFAVERRKE